MSIGPRVRFLHALLGQREEVVAHFEKLGEQLQRG